MFKLSFFLLALFSPLAGQKPVSGSNGQLPPSSIVSIKAPVYELLKGYQEWIPRHPDTVPKSMSSKPTLPTPEAPTFLLRMPSIDLYSPSGVSVYHDTNCEQNAAYIRSLQKTHRSTGNNSEQRPTLREAIGMFKELADYRVESQVENYTLLAVTYPENVKCDAQDEAIQHIRSDAINYKIRIIQIQLRK